ncbi:MAG TPA: FAD-dependent oxidoreductase [Clostridiales bacterium]|nr:FAD-dependent oxidoreductase [Clostridiales bacterium]
MKVLIVGGVAGGASAAARMRRLSETAEIIMFERGGYVSFANCGLPYYVGGSIEEQDELILQTPEDFYQRFAIDVRLFSEVVAVDPANKTVTVRSNGEEYRETYDKLILSPGASPAVPPLPGRDDPRIFTLRTVPDAEQIKQYMDKHQPQKAVVIGGGFIGLEMAENLAERGLAVTIVEMAPQVAGFLDRDMASVVHHYLREKGIALKLGQKASGFQPYADRVDVLLEGETLKADLVLLSLGVKPDTAFLAGSGLSMSEKGAILVNAHMQTSDPDVYAVGDAVLVPHFVTNQPTFIPLAGPANKQGRIAADHIAGLPASYKGTQGSSVLKLFDMTIAATGLTEAGAKAAGLACDAVYLWPLSHASYYPNPTSIAMKVVFEKPSGRILGAQLAGFEGVDKRCDVLATAIRAGMTADDLTELELCYAPPFSSAKDPVNMAGYMIQNVISGLVEQFHWHEVSAIKEDPNAVWLDVRTPGEYRRGHLENSLLIPVDSLRERIDELAPFKDKTIYINCQSGLRSYIACRMLAQRGFACKNLAGGYRLYQTVMEDQAAR